MLVNKYSLIKVLNAVNVYIPYIDSITSLESTGGGV